MVDFERLDNILRSMEVVEEERLLTISEAHRRLPISLPGLYNLVRDNKIPSVRIGRRLYIKEQVILKILEGGSTSFTTHRRARCPA
jgi:excisionase family DNA binding protein